MADQNVRRRPGETQRPSRPDSPRRERSAEPSTGGFRAATPRRAPKPLLWIGGGLVVLAVGLAVFAALFQWNWLRGPIDSYASGRLHRQVVIHGDLSARIWSWTPSATARDVTVAEPGWAKPGEMANLPSLTASIDLRQLLKGRLILPVVALEQPRATLFRDAAGRNNWTFAPPGAAPQPLKLPAIRHLTIDEGRLSLFDARRKIAFVGVVSSNERIAGYGHGRFTLVGQGVLDRTPFTAQVLGGTLLDVDPDRPYPFLANIAAGPTHVQAQGDITHPFDLGVMQAATHIRGPDLASLYFLTGVALPDTPPYDLTGELRRNGALYDVSRINGRIGSSDLAGRLVLNEAGGRRDLTGDLASHRLRLADLTAVFGGAPKAVIKGAVASPLQKAEAAKLSAEHRILPDAKLDVVRVREMDADVRYRAETVDAGRLPIRQVALHAKLDHGLLTVAPFSFSLPQGALSGRVRLDARPATPRTAIDITLARAQLGELVAKSKGAGQISGEVEGRARITGDGDSVRQAAAHSDGVVAFAIPRGEMRRLFAELMGVDVTKSLFLYLAKDNKPTPVRCAVAEFRDQGGVLTAQRILLDTGAMQATGKGVIDLRNETINLAIAGKPKHFRLVRLAAPITVKGRLDAPKVGVDLGKSAAQLGVGALLGAMVNPLAAILPFISTGTKDANCQALLQEAALEGAPLSHG